MLKISKDKAAEAYAATAEARQTSLLIARAARTLAAHIDNAFVTRRIEPKIQALFPAWRVHYCAMYGGDKYAIFTSADALNSRRLEIRLARKDCKRISAAELIQQTEYHEQQAQRYAKALEVFWDRLGQYNALVGTIDTLQKELSPVMVNARYFQF